MILAVLQIDMTGMAALEFLTPSVLLRFKTNADLGDLKPASSQIGSAKDYDLKFEGNNADVG